MTTTPAIALLACPHCEVEVNAVSGTLTACTGCGRPLLADIFPRRNLAAAPALAAARAAGADATCYFHATAVAEQACQTCGRYLCALCDIELQGQHYCPTCVQSPGTAAAAQLRSEELLYDALVLWLGWAWMLIWPSWLLAAPACGYLTIKHWRAPRTSIVPRGRWRFVLGDSLLLLGPAMFVLLVVLIALAGRR